MEDEFTYDRILERLAPCGLDCHRCVMFDDGVVKQAALELATALDGFEHMAARIAERVQVLEGYPQFAEVLSFLTGGSCSGCRNGGASFPFCAARTCFKEKGVDFCFQCDEYPCGRNSYPEPFEERWQTNNDRMREAGVETYYRESLEQPRYR